MWTGRLSISGYDITRYNVNFQITRGFDVLRFMRGASHAGGFDTLIFGEISADFWLKNIDIIVYNREDEMDWQRQF